MTAYRRGLHDFGRCRTDRIVRTFGVYDDIVSIRLVQEDAGQDDEVSFYMRPGEARELTERILTVLALDEGEE